MNTQHPNICHKGIHTGVIAAGLLLLASCGSTSTNSASTNPPSEAATATIPNSPTPSNDVAPTTPVDTAAPSITQAPASGAAANTFADPCSLLTQAEVDTAAGQPLGAGKQTSTLDDCGWGNNDFSASVDVSVSDWAGVKYAATANGTKAPPPAAAGIGDEAYYYEGLLYVRKGDAGFLLSVGWPEINKEPDYGLAKATVLAQAVLGRL